jgi:hypothetical protein
MTNMATFLAGYGLPMLIVCGTIRDTAQNVSEGCPADIQDQIIAAYKQVSDEQPNVAFLDWTTLFPGATTADRYTAQQASGYIQDTVHPNSAGCTYFGQTITAEALLYAI